MGSLFQGSPQTATSYTTSSTETPKWMQDAIYNQIQLAQNVANTPYQPYSMPTVAALSPLQQQAYSQVQANQGLGQAQMNTAQQGAAALTQAPGALNEARGYFNQAARMGGDTQPLAQGQRYYEQAGNINIGAAAKPYLDKSAQTAVQGIDQYMNPYQSSVLDVIAKQGARNLSENLLPGVSDAFIRAGGFGGNRMGEFGSRALRDTQEAILNQQAALAQQGYTQALGASQTDLARQAQLGQLAGGFAGQQMQGLTGLGTAQTGAGQAQQQALISIGGQTGGLTTSDLARQQAGYNQMGALAQQAQGMRAADVAALESAGASQQGQAQAQLNAAQQQYQNEQLYPRQQLDWLSTQVRGMAPITPTSTTSSGSTTGATYSASPLSQLATGLYTYKGLQGLG
jgi:hypothetical protein